MATARAPASADAMSWNEPRVIAARLAAALEVPLREASGDEGEAVLLVSTARLAELSDEQVRACAALVVAGTAGATSDELVALREAVVTRGLTPALATFATVSGTNGPVEAALVVGARENDERVQELLAAGPHALPLDRAVDASASAASAPPARVCVVTFEVAGMTGGGIGTASSALAELLARSGHEVTLLFTGWREREADDDERWRAHYAERGVRLAFVRDEVAPVLTPHRAISGAYEVFRWLSHEAPFDVVHVPDNLGQGFYAQAAKRQGLRFAQTTFVVGTHGPTRWAAEANRVVLTREEFLVQDALERASVARADVLLGPSRYLHDYLRARGWLLPERVYVQPYAMPGAVRRAQAQRLHEPEPVQRPSELVFFGRLETRKGVETLCDALDLLAGDDHLPTVEVTFLGPVADVLGTPADAYVAARAKRWPWRWRIVDGLDQQDAAAYLRRPGVLAVMPSLVDNAPNTVSEAVTLGVPFVASRVGGTGELVAAMERDRYTFAGPATSAALPVPLHEPTPAVDARPLADLLRRRLATSVPPAQPPVDPSAVEAAYDRWHRAVRAVRAADPTGAEPIADDLPVLAACVLFEGDEQLLADQLDALADVECVVADMCERPGGAVAAADARGVAIVRPEQPGHAAEARTAAVAATRGALVAIIPAGDLPLPSFAETLRRATAMTGADACSCVVLDAREAADRIADGAVARALPALVPIPGPPLAGVSAPAFAVGPYVIRRAALARLGGFAVNARGDECDHELLNRAVADGMRLEVVPEPLAAKPRVDRWTDVRSLLPYGAARPPYDDEQTLRVMRPLIDDANSDVLGLLLGARGDATRLARALREQHDVYEERTVELRDWIDGLEATAAQLREDRETLLATADALRADQATILAHQAQLHTEREALLAERSILTAELELRRSLLRMLAHDARRVLRVLRQARRG